MNPRRYYPQVDEKHLTKRLCRTADIPVPDTYALIENNGDVRRFFELSGNRPEFVIKPAAGSRAGGSWSSPATTGGTFSPPAAKHYTLADLRYHISAILSGLYSLKGKAT